LAPPPGLDFRPFPALHFREIVMMQKPRIIMIGEAGSLGGLDEALIGLAPAVNELITNFGVQVGTNALMSMFMTICVQNHHPDSVRQSLTETIDSMPQIYAAANAARRARAN
jgi:hypothetical protein